MSAVTVEAIGTGRGSGAGLGPMPAGVTGRHLRLVGVDEGQAAATFRLTRFGRLVRTALLAVVVSVAVMALWGGAAGAASPGQRVTVQPGQTLSQIAGQHLSELPVADAVVNLQLSNGLSSAQVHAGQELVIPELP